MPIMAVPTPMDTVRTVHATVRGMSSTRTQGGGVRPANQLGGWYGDVRHGGLRVPERHLQPQFLPARCLIGSTLSDDVGIIRVWND